MAAIEILKSTARTRDYIEKGEREGKSLYDAMRDGNLEGMQHIRFRIGANDSRWSHHVERWNGLPQQIDRT